MQVPIAMQCSRSLRMALRWLARPDAKRRVGDRGVTTLEFAILLPLFMTFVFMIFQFAMVLATLELLDNAAVNAARLMRIGTYTGSAYSSALAASVCSNLSPTGLKLVQNCSTSIQIYVAASASGTPAGSGFKLLTPAVVNSGTMTTSKAALAAKDDVLLEIGYYYPWVIFQPKAGNTMLISTIAFQTEAY